MAALFDFECSLLEILPKNSMFVAVSGVTKLGILQGFSPGNPIQLPTCRLVAGVEQTLTDNVYGFIVELDVNNYLLGIRREASHVVTFVAPA